MGTTTATFVRRGIATGAVLILLATGAACTAGSGTGLGQPERAEQLWSQKLDVLGQAAVTDGVAVVYARAKHRRLQVVGVDVADGSILWRRKAAPAGGFTALRTPLVAESSAGDAYVVYRAPGTSYHDSLPWWTRITVVEPRTGRVQLATEPVFATSGLDSCADGTDACLTGYNQARLKELKLRIDLENMWLNEHRVSAEGYPRNAQILHKKGLYIDFSASGDKGSVGVVWDGERLWSADARTVLGTPVDGFIQGGIGYLRDRDIFVLSLHRTQLPEHATKRRVRLSTWTMVGVSRQTGQVLWREPGTFCADALGINGTVLSSRAGEPGTDPLEVPPVRCRGLGEATLHADARPTVKDIDVVLEGFDPMTGKTTWSTPAGDAPWLMVDSDKISRPGSKGLRPLRVEDGPRVLDMFTGKLSAPPGDVSFLCYRLERYRYHVKFSMDSNRDEKWNGGFLASRCDADGEPTTDPLPRRAVAGSQAAFGDVAVIAYEGRLVGYRLSDG